MASNNFGKSRARKVGKFLRVLEVLGTKWENFQQITNKLEETPCIVFATIVLRTWNNISSFFFFFFFNLFNLWYFFIERYLKTLVWKTLGSTSGGWQENDMYVSCVMKGYSPKSFMCERDGRESKNQRWTA